MLCLIPGLIMACVLYVGLPAVVVENRGPIEAIRRSDGLTEGFRWGIFGLLFVVWLAQALLGSGVNMVVERLDFRAENLQLYTTLIQLAAYTIQVVITTLSSVFVAVSYHDLRVSRDGIDSGDLVSVFD